MSVGPWLLAVGFVHPVLLVGLGLAGLPVVIHLLSRRRFRRIEWGATRFLLEAERQTRRRVRFEQWLLVALRGLALALLAVLVARPFVRPGLVAALLGGRGQVARVIVLDDSASLGYRTGAAPEFARLKDAADRLLSWLHQEAPDDPVTFCLTSGAGEPLLHNAVLGETELSELRGRLARGEPVNLRAQPRRVFAGLAERFAGLDMAGMDVYVLSDFQRSDWIAPADVGDSVFAPLLTLGVPGSQTGATATGKSARVVLIASGVAPRSNVALVGLQLERPQTVAGFPAVVRATVANSGREPVKDLVVQVRIDEDPLPAVPVGLVEADGERDVSLEVTFPDEGYHVLALTLGPVDSFRVDDVRCRTVFVKGRLAVLVVNGAPAADRYQDEVFLLRNALTPPGPLSSGLRVDVIEPEDLDAAELARYDAVLLCNVPPPSPAAVSRLQRYVRGGGGLGLFLGGAIGDPAEYNRVFWAEGSGLLPLPLARLGAPPGQAAGVGLVRTQPHAVTALFPGGTDTLSEYVHFWRYYRCAEDPAAPGVVLARYADQQATPALIERAFGRGRVLLFTSSVDLDWNDWARAPDGSYVVTLLELVQYLARRATDPTGFVAGERLHLALSPDAYEPSAVFKSPAFPQEPAVVVDSPGPSAEANAGLVLEGPTATHLGTYVAELTTRAGGRESRPLCVNLDPAESDLTVATPASLEATLDGIRHELIPAAEDFLQGAEQTQRELWPAALVLLIVTLLLEQGLAWRFGLPGGLRTKPRSAALART